MKKTNSNSFSRLFVNRKTNNRLVSYWGRKKKRMVVILGQRKRRNRSMIILFT